MRRKILFALLLLASLPLHAQWSGGVDVAGGYGWMPQQEESMDPRLDRHLGQAGARLTYKTPVLLWETALNASYEHKDTDGSQFLFGEKDGSVEHLTMNSHFQEGKTKNLDTRFRSDLRWTPSPTRQYESWLQYRMLRGSEYHFTFEHHSVFEGEDPLEEEMGVTTENLGDNRHQLSTGIRMAQGLGGTRRMLKGELSFDGTALTRNDEWVNVEISGLEEKEEVEQAHYRLTPRTNSGVLTSIFHYTDSLLTGAPCTLVIDPGVRLLVDNTLDRYSGSTLVDEAHDVWRDSTRLREDFQFLALRAEPYFAADLSWRNLKVHLDYAPQFYARRLAYDKFREGSPLRKVYPVGNGFVEWSISPRHKVTLRNTLSVQHPEFAQICRFNRQGAFPMQLLRGNELLESILSRTFLLEYAFKFGGFLSTFGLTYTRRLNELDRTFFDTKIDGRDYTVFTWVNAADSHRSGVQEVLEWKGKWLTAHLGGSYNGTERRVRKTGQVKKSDDWRAWADVTATLPKDWTLHVDADYRSAVATLYSLSSAYCAMNARIQKRFSRITVYAEGRDLLDTPVSRQYLSQDGNDWWEETARMNRRLFLLGLRWDL